MLPSQETTCSAYIAGTSPYNGRCKHGHAILSVECQVVQSEKTFYTPLPSCITDTRVFDEEKKTVTHKLYRLAKD
jgi:hypothetical protein